jgi:CelD/BcsL family acetyltransferase involved in cellulose biosynthesis
MDAPSGSPRVERLELAEFPASTLDGLAAKSFFASSAFAALWRAQGGTPVVWTVENRGQLVAVLPGVEFGHGRWARFHSMPDGCYGGCLFTTEGQGESRRWAGHLLDALVRRAYLKTYLFDFYGRLPEDRRYTAVEETTTLVDIDETWTPEDKKLLSQIRAAERQGIEVVPFDWEQDAEKFLALVHVTEKRHGAEPRYSRAFYEALADLAAVDPRVHWLWCEHDGRAACSHIYFREGGMLQGWQIFFDKQFSFLKPNQYMRFTMCRRMASQGVKILNLGATPKGAKGLVYYKRRWGGRPRAYRILVLKRGLGRLL